MNIFDPGDEDLESKASELGALTVTDGTATISATEIVKVARKAKKKGAKKAAKAVKKSAKKGAKKDTRAASRPASKSSQRKPAMPGKKSSAKSSGSSKRGPKGRPESQRMRKGDAIYGKRIAAARKAKGLTQYALAEKMGVGQPSICNVEKGTLGAGVAMQRLFKKHLGVPLSKACEAAIERGSVNQVKVRGT